MSTKFSVRPAPRKRPWICKRSPPCLIPPPIPASLLCTYQVTILTGPFAPQTVRGSFALPHVGAPGWTFQGADPTGGPFWIDWNYNPNDRTAAAWSMYGSPGYIDMGDWGTKPGGTVPNIHWASYTLRGSVFVASGVCLVTS